MGNVNALTRNVNWNGQTLQTLSKDTAIPGGAKKGFQIFRNVKNEISYANFIECRTNCVEQTQA
jgi:hypothetical protein